MRKKRKPVKLRLNTDQKRVMYYVLSPEAISILKRRMARGGTSYDKIAEDLGVSKTAVWRRVDRSIKKIDRAIMKEKLRTTILDVEL
jgi:DNA-directed RNA polymerase specialized sigma24 family protein